MVPSKSGLLVSLSVAMPKKPVLVTLEEFQDLKTQLEEIGGVPKWKVWFSKSRGDCRCWLFGHFNDHEIMIYSAF